MPRETLKHTARGSAHASEPKSRRKVHVENVHEVELPKDPVIVVGGGELVARELAAREHHPAAKTTAAPGRTRSDRGRTWSTKQLLRVIKMDGVETVDVDRHPCARKQARIGKFLVSTSCEFSRGSQLPEKRPEWRVAAGFFAHATRDCTSVSRN